MWNAVALADHPTIAFGSEVAGAINSISATPLASGVWGLGFRTEIIDNDALSNEQLEDFATAGSEGVHSIDRITNTSLSFSYGASKDLTLSLRLPYIVRENIKESEIENGLPEAHIHGDSSGVGDLLLFAQYRLLERVNTDVSILWGIKAPTGETEEKDKDGIRFETEFQPGSGSWDVLLGAAVTRKDGNIGYFANILYNKTTEGSQSTEIGDAIAYNAALTYRFNENHDGHVHEHKSGKDGFNWDLSAELNGETRQKNTIDGVSQENSGGSTIFLMAGVRLSTGMYSGFISYGEPIVERYNGIQTDIDYRIVAGVSFAL